MGFPIQAAQLPYITNPNGLRRWHQALSEAWFKDAPVLCIGDSHTYGENYDGAGSYDNETAAAQGYPAQLRKLFAATWGDPGEGFIFPSESRVTSGGGITTGVYQGPSVLRQNRRFTSSSHTLTLTIPSGVSITRLGVIQGNGSAGTEGTVPGTGGANNAQITYTKNGGGSTNLTSPTNTGLPLVTEISCTAGDVFVFTGPASGQNTVTGFYFRTAQQYGVPVHRMGQRGYTASNIGGGSYNGSLWTPNGTNTLTDGQIEKQIQAHYKWAEGVTGGAKGVLVIPFGTNEQSKQLLSTGIDCGITPALYSTVLTAVVQQAAEDGWCTLLVSPCPSGSEVTTAGSSPLTSYAAAAKAVALANDHTAFIDVADVWGGGADPITGVPVSAEVKSAAKTAAASAGLRDSGSSHPTRKGYGSYAQIIHRALTAIPQGA